MITFEAYGLCDLRLLLVQGGWMVWWSSLKRQGSTMCCTLCYAVTTGGTPCRPLPGTFDPFVLLKGVRLSRYANMLVHAAPS